MILLFIGIVYSCDKRVESSTMKNIEITEFQKKSDIDSVKYLISNSFQDIFSDLDSAAVSKSYTRDFILLENGVVWNNDSIYSYITRSLSKKRNYKRLNSFDFLKSVHNKNTIWIAYDNYAFFVKEKDTLGSAHWLESAVAKKENNKWKLEQLHSTVIKK